MYQSKEVSPGHAPAQEQGHGLLDATQDLPRKIRISQAYLAINHALNSFTAIVHLGKKKSKEEKRTSSNGGAILLGVQALV
jgi:hypothetical protein